MQRLNTILAILALIIASTALTVAAWSTPKACVPVTVPPNVVTDCPVGGTICAGSEGQHCAGTWPFRKYCTTVYPTGGTCRCSCQ